jgi:hypothetical protein
MNAKKTWSCFLGAAIMAAHLPLENGAPPLAVAAGIGGAAMFLLRR